MSEHTSGLEKSLLAMALSLAFAWFVLGPMVYKTVDQVKHRPPLTRTLDTLPTGTIVVCYTPTHGDGVACVLDPAMQGATP